MTDANCSGRLLRDCAVLLAENDLRLCVLHGHEDYPLNIESDLDCLCSEPRQIPRILSSHGVDVVQAIEMGPDAFYYVLHRGCGKEPAFVALDVSADYRRDGVLFLNRTEVYRSSRSIGEINVPATEIEFAAYVIKRLLKQSIESRHADLLEKLYRADPNACGRQLSRFFAAEEAALLAQAAITRDWKRVRMRSVTLRKRLLKRRRTRNPIGTVVDVARDLRRRVSRCLRPTGLCVTFLGPDDPWMRTLMTRVGTDLAPAFWRVHSATASGTGGVRRSDRQFNGALRSLLLSPTLFAARVLRAVAVYRKVVRSTLVLLQAEPTGLAARSGLASRLIERLAPPRALVFVLDARADALVFRRERVFGERTRQGTERLAGARQAIQVMDASRPLDEVAVKVEQLIIQHMTRRTARRFGLDVNDRRARRPVDVSGEH